MTTYINTTTGEYPRHIGDILIVHPSADPSGDILPSGWAKVEYVASPLPSAYNPLIQRAFQLTPLLVGGVYSMQWAVRDMTANEIDTINYKPSLISEPPNLDKIPGALPDVIG